MNGAQFDRENDTVRLDNLLDDDLPARLQVTMRAQLKAFREKMRTGQTEHSFFRYRRWLGSAAAAVAACAAVCLIALLFHNGTASVYAQAIEALRQAKTVHAQVFRLKDGKTVKEAEIWYDAARGVREWIVKAEGTVEERLDDGQAQWVYRSSGRTAFKSRSRDPVGALTAILNFDKHIIEEMKARRWTQADRTINGIPCHGYVSDPAVDGKQRNVLWVDAEHRPHRFEHQTLDESRWAPDRYAEIAYDQPVQEDRFRPDFGPGVTVVDSTTFKIDLDGNLLKAEVLGLALAAHEVRRLDNGLILIVWSIRPTEETVHRLGPIVGYGTKTYGDALVSNPSRLSSDQSVWTMDIAQWTLDGVRVQWTVLIPRGNWPQPMGSMPLGFNVYSRNELQKAFEKNGQPWYQLNFILGELALPQESTSTEEAYRKVYEQTTGLWNVSGFGGIGGVFLTGRNRPLSEKEKQEQIKAGSDPRSVEEMSVTPYHAPSELTSEQFIQNVQHNYEDMLKVK